MSLGLAGRNAVVTGSTARIGLAIATALATEGASCGGERANAGARDGAIEQIRHAVNNLGIFEAKPFAEIPDADWMRIFEVNVQIPVEMIHYGMTKTAQVAVARGLAEALAGTGVTVNSVLAGPTASEGVGTFVQDLARQQGTTKEDVERQFFSTGRPTSLLGRFERPEEIAAVVAFMASVGAGIINGAAVRADGGVVRSIF